MNFNSELAGKGGHLVEFQAGGPMFESGIGTLYDCNGAGVTVEVSGEDGPVRHSYRWDALNSIQLHTPKKRTRKAAK